MSKNNNPVIYNPYGRPFSTDDIDELLKSLDDHGKVFKNDKMPANKSTVCDCGGAKCKTTHSRWCSVYKK